MGAMKGTLALWILLLTASMAATQTVINGGFSAWTEWNTASVPCPSACGVASIKVVRRSRACDSPAPENGGQDCQGDRRQTKKVNCRLQECQNPGPCDVRYSSIRSDHTMCGQDRAEAAPVILTEQQEQEIVDRHNTYRAQQIGRGAVGLMEVVWDEEIAVIAAKWARQCNLGHDQVYQRFVPTLPGVDIGQNVAFGYSDFQSAMAAWYNEINNFQYGIGSTGGDVSHYTQIVNQYVTRIGCGQAVCLEFGQMRNYFTCNYAKSQRQLEKPYCSSIDTTTTCLPCLTQSSLGLCDCGGKVCMNNGELNQATCQCGCSSSNYYTGANCETLTCPGFDRSFCTNPSNCDRFARYIAECPNSCQICPRTCNKVCQNGGTQNTIPCTCHCTSDYTGELCQLPIIDGVFSQWTEWNTATAPCPSNCGTAALKEVSRNRNCNSPAPANGGRDCVGNSRETRLENCGLSPCTGPVNGNWGAWTVVNNPSCSITCGTRNDVFLTRSRQCNNPAPSNGGQTCPGSSTDQPQKNCSFPACPGPVDGSWGPWNVVNDPPCLITCGTRNDVFQDRSRQCNNPAPSNGGQSCPGSPTDQLQKNCSFPSCPALVIVVDSTPSTPQVGATAVFTVELNQDNVQNGVWFKDNVRLFNSSKTIITVNGRTQQLVVTDVQTADAGDYTYSVNGLTSTSTLTPQGVTGWDQWSEWGGQTVCSVTCGGGTQPQFRSRNCVNRPLGCRGEQFETRRLVCNTDPCTVPVDGNWGGWTLVADPPCTITCGTRNDVFQDRRRECDNPAPSNGGQTCPGPGTDRQQKNCTFPPCPVAVDGNWGSWTVVTNPPCAITCGTRNDVFITRRRECDNPAPRNGGQTCPGSPSDRSQKNCTFPSCPVSDLCSNAYRNFGVGYRYHPTDCDKYIQCYYNPNGNVLGVYRSCPFGFFWDQTSLRCNQHWKVNCTIEPCSGKCKANYGMSGSCRAYWQCSGGVSVPKCCMSGFMYEEGHGCIPNFFCRDVCPTACADRDACNKRPDWSGDNAGYNVSVGLIGWLPTRCRAGTYFDVTDCGCSPLNSTCRADYDINFSDDDFLNNARSSWIRDNNVIIANGIATFRADSYFFANITKSTSTSNCPVIITFRYRETTAVLGRRVLISTSNCKKGHSLVIAIDNDFITFEVTSWYGNLVKLPISTLGYSRSTWKTVVFMYNGYEMIASIQGERTKYSARAYASDSTIMECGLMVGSDGMTNTPRFIGEIDRLTVYRCDPGNVF